MSAAPSPVRLTDDSIVCASSDHLSAVLSDDEAVLLGIAKGRYYGLSGVGPRVWELVARPTPVSAILDAITREFEVDVDQVRADLLPFLRSLAAEDLIDVRDPA